MVNNRPRLAVERYDVVVGGGGAAGVAAAVGAARTGARTLLLERTTVLGGAATARGVLGYCGLWTCEPSPRRAVRGVVDDLLARLRNLGGVSDPVVLGEGNWAVVFLDPEAVKLALDQLCAREGVDVRLSSAVTAVRRNGDVVDGLTYSDYGGASVDVSLAAIVDATGDAVLTALSGAAATIGVAGRTQTATMAARYGGMDPDAEVTPATLGAAVDKAVSQKRPNLTSSSGLVARLPTSGDVVTYLADEDVDALDGRSYSAATRHAREQAWAYLEILRALPGCEGAYLVSTGPELGIRQSRHMVSRVPLRDRTLLEGIVTDDAVALGAWPSEYHPGSGLPSQWTKIGGDLSFGITLNNLRSADISNLFAAGRVLTGDRNIGASARVMGTAFATGHASGIAAAQCADGQDPDAGARTELDRQGALLRL